PRPRRRAGGRCSGRPSDTLGGSPPTPPPRAPRPTRPARRRCSPPAPSPTGEWRCRGAPRSPAGSPSPATPGPRRGPRPPTTSWRPPPATTPARSASAAARTRGELAGPDHEDGGSVGHRAAEDARGSPGRIPSSLPGPEEHHPRPAAVTNFTEEEGMRGCTRRFTLCVSYLFEPIKLRDVLVPNRVWVSPMCQYSATDGVPNDWHLVHLGQFATGGAGL